MDPISLSNQTQKLKFTTFGGQVLSWEYRSNSDSEWKNILYQGSTNKRSGIPVLFPFANPLNDDIFNLSGRKIGQHGFARNCNWKILNKEESRVTLVLTDSMIPLEMQLAYPFQFKLEINLTLEGQDTFKYELNVFNLSNKIMPIAPGIHPYFNVKHDLKSFLKIDGIEEFRAEDFNWNSKLGGDFFSFNSKATIVFPQGYSVQLEDKYNDYKHLVVWSQDLSEPDHDFVCFEPFTCTTNSINDNPLLILPDRRWSSEILFRIKTN